MVFSFLTFAASWLLWAAAFRLAGGDFTHPSRFTALGGALYLLGVFAPALVAIVLTALRDGGDRVRTLLRRVIAWDVGPRYYVFAILFYPVARLAGAAVERIVLGVWPGASSESLGVMLVATVLSAPIQAGEEVGWRGFLLPRLSARLGLPLASLVVGVVWAAWHLPFFFMPGTDKTGQPFPAYVAGLTALSVAMAWLYWRTRGSLLLAMLMHAAVNNLRPMATPPVAAGSPFALRGPLMTWSAIGCMWIAAAGLLFTMRGVRDLPGNSRRSTLAQIPCSVRTWLNRVVRRSIDILYR
jgi:membrane protease YdiL (CAAX protease family)